VRVGDGATEAYICSDGAVVGALSSRVAIVWPTKWLLGELGGLSKKCVLLLNAVPGLFGLHLHVFPNLVCEVSEVGVGGDESLPGVVLPLVSLTHHNDVVTSSEGVLEEGDWLEDDLRHLSGGLVGAGTIVVPLGAVFNGLDLLGEGAGFRAKTDT